ncbi:MAG: hypothetical protein E6H66_04445 [Betaproteobacteria bacterium]|nr:MAG: hypothetical protein E6H66_04445 [Betaproteobacteria bacterium]
MRTIMKTLFAICSIALALGLSPVRAHGDDPQAGHDDTFGKPGDPAKVSRTIEVDMTDAMRFTPTKISVRKGETVRFAVTNSGRLKHEMVLGTARELRAHAELMKKFPEMEHEDPNQLSLEGGRKGELIWQFTKSGTFDFACLQPGHFEAGMRGRIAVK